MSTQLITVCTFNHWRFPWFYISAYAVTLRCRNCYMNICAGLFYKCDKHRKLKPIIFYNKVRFVKARKDKLVPSKIDYKVMLHVYGAISILEYMQFSIHGTYKCSWWRRPRLLQYIKVHVIKVYNRVYFRTDCSSAWAQWFYIFVALKQKASKQNTDFTHPLLYFTRKQSNSYLKSLLSAYCFLKKKKNFR